MVYVLMCDDAAAGGHEVRSAVDAVLSDGAAATAEVSIPETVVRRTEPDPATWGLMPHQIERAEAAQRLGARA